jgi:integrase
MRVRGALGTCNKDAANRLKHRLDLALSEGPLSTLWAELRVVLPEGTFFRFANFVGVKAQITSTWDDLFAHFIEDMDFRITIRKLAPTSAGRYKQTLRQFEIFLEQLKQTVSSLSDFDEKLMEEFARWRVEQIKQHSGTGASVEKDLVRLHTVFEYGRKKGMIAKNPVPRSGYRDRSEGGAKPFGAEELVQLRRHAGEDKMVFLVLRWTGLRKSDAIAVSFQDVDLDRKELQRVTQKCHKKVFVPVDPELFAALREERERRNASPTDPILLNPNTGRPFNRSSLYARVVALGKRAGVPNAYPRRFRATFAADLFMKGASTYLVAQALGDTEAVVKRHYASFIPELRSRLRFISDTGIGFGDDKIVPLSGAEPILNPQARTEDIHRDSPEKLGSSKHCSEDGNRAVSILVTGEGNGDVPLAGADLILSLGEGAGRGTPDKLGLLEHGSKLRCVRSIVETGKGCHLDPVALDGTKPSSNFEAAQDASRGNPKDRSSRNLPLCRKDRTKQEQTPVVNEHRVEPFPRKEAVAIERAQAQEAKPHILLSQKLEPVSESSILRYSKFGRRVLRRRRSDQKITGLPPGTSAGTTTAQ